MVCRRFIAPLFASGLTLFVVWPGLSQLSRRVECDVSGRVVDSQSGMTVRKAVLTLEPVGGHQRKMSLAANPYLGSSSAAGRSRYTARSGADGEFCFGPPVAAGQYELSAKKRGYLTTGYGSMGSFQRSAILEVRSESSVDDRTVRLIPHGVISGRVVDSEGEPIDTGVVQLLSTAWLSGKRRILVAKTALPNDLGEFRIAGLQTGTYYVRFQPRPSGGSPHPPEADNIDIGEGVPTYYSSAIAFRQASPIGIGTGMHVSGIDIIAREGATYTVQGRLLISGKPPEFSSISLVPEGMEPATVIVGGGAGPGGEFYFPNTAAGTYDLFYLAGLEGKTSVGKTILNVVDQDVTGIFLEAPPTVSISGSVTVDGENDADISKVVVRLTTAEALVGPNYDAAVRSDGSFVLEDCSLGRYRLSVLAPPQMYFKEARYGSRDVVDHEIEVSDVGSDLKVVLRNGVTRLSGTIAAGDAGGHWEGAYYVVLPLRRPFDPFGIRFGHTDNRGAFVVEGLPPGRYRVFGFATPDIGAFQNPNILNTPKSLGTEVKLTESREAVVTTDLISAKDGSAVFDLGRRHAAR